jgi:hypothetical protein
VCPTNDFIGRRDRLHLDQVLGSHAREPPPLYVDPDRVLEHLVREGDVVRRPGDHVDEDAVLDALREQVRRDHDRLEPRRAEGLERRGDVAIVHEHVDVGHTATPAQGRGRDAAHHEVGDPRSLERRHRLVEDGEQALGIGRVRRMRRLADRLDVHRVGPPAPVRARGSYPHRRDSTPVSRSAGRSPAEVSDAPFDWIPASSRRRSIPLDGLLDPVRPVPRLGAAVLDQDRREHDEREQLEELRLPVLERGLAERDEEVAEPDGLTVRALLLDERAPLRDPLRDPTDDEEGQELEREREVRPDARES